MPQAILLTLNPIDLRGLPRDCTGALHRQMFEWLRTADPALAATVHDKGHVAGAQSRGARPNASAPGGRFGPFTLGPRDPATHAPNISEYFVTTLTDDDALFAKLCGAMLKHPRVDIDHTPVRFGDTPHLGADRSYADLAANAAHDARIRLDFRTPTFFESAGVRIAAPDPLRVFKGTSTSLRLPSGCARWSWLPMRA
jgi:hypothetical protein